MVDHDLLVIFHSINNTEEIPAGNHYMESQLGFFSALTPAMHIVIKLQCTLVHQLIYECTLYTQAELYYLRSNQQQDT